MITRSGQVEFFDSLLCEPSAPGRRLARSTIARSGPRTFVLDQLWPALTRLDALNRDHAVSNYTVGRALCRIGSLARQAAFCHGSHARKSTLSALIVSGRTRFDETAGDVVAAILETHDIFTRLCGGGVPISELLQELRARPVDLLFIASIGPDEAPVMRHIMDAVRALPTSARPYLMAGGGLFARAEGLALEMGADWEFRENSESASMLQVISSAGHVDSASRYAA